MVNSESATAPPPRGPEPNAPVISVGDWMVTALIFAIPVVNIIMLFVWAFSDGVNPNKRNYCRASLIWFAIVVVIYIFLAIAFFGVFATTFSFH